MAVFARASATDARWTVVFARAVAADARGEKADRIANAAFAGAERVGAGGIAGATLGYWAGTYVGSWVTWSMTEA